MDQLTYYYDLMSQPCRTLFIFLKLNKIPFESKYIDIGMGDHLSEEYSRINPMKQVPTITHGDFILSESISIIGYLRSKYNLNSKWYPNNMKLGAKVDEYLSYQHLGLRAPCTHYFRAKFLYPMMTGKEHKPEYIKLLEKNMSKAVDTFQRVWLGNKQFICGDGITIADVYACSELEQPALAGYNVRVGRPVLSSWMERVRKETNPYYDEAHSKLYDLIKQTQPKAKY